MGIFGALFISGLVIYFLGWIVSLKEKAEYRHWEENLHRRTEGKPELPPTLMSRLTIRSCLWTFVLTSMVIVFGAQWLSTVWR